MPGVVSKLCEHVIRMKKKAASYKTAVDVFQSRELRTETTQFLREYGPQIWPDDCPTWLHSRSERPCYSRDANTLEQQFWMLIVAKCEDFFRHNTHLRGLPNTTPDTALPEIHDGSPDTNEHLTSEACSKTTTGPEDEPRNPEPGVVPMRRSPSYELETIIVANSGVRKRRASTWFESRAEKRSTLSSDRSASLPDVACGTCRAQHRKCVRREQGACEACEKRRAGAFCDHVESSKTTVRACSRETTVDRPTSIDPKIGHPCRNTRGVDVIRQLQAAAKGARSEPERIQPIEEASKSRRSRLLRPTARQHTSRPSGIESNGDTSVEAAALAVAETTTNTKTGSVTGLAVLPVTGPALNPTTVSITEAAIELADESADESARETVGIQVSRSSTYSYLSLYVTGCDGLKGVVEVSSVATREDLFNLIREDLEGEFSQICSLNNVRIERADGEPFARFKERLIPIKLTGRHDLWAGLVKPMLDGG